MIQIRPVSDLRNKYPEIENIVANEYSLFLMFTILSGVAYKSINCSS